MVMMLSEVSLIIYFARRCMSIGLLRNSPLLKDLSAIVLIKVLKPSSIHGYFLSLLPTIIGNQLCPNSCDVTPHKPLLFALYPQNTMPGYSIPPTIPATLDATG